MTKPQKSTKQSSRVPPYYPFQSQEDWERYWSGLPPLKPKKYLEEYPLTEKKKVK